MASRILQPDTAADITLRSCLDETPVRCFIMIAGAGSGKTTSLIKALDHLVKTRGSALRCLGQKVACITYTEVAVREIENDIGNLSLLHVSTIHSFLWTIIKPFQSDIMRWVHANIEAKIVDARKKIQKQGTRQATKDRLTQDIIRFETQRASLDGVAYFTYSTGSDYAKGVLGHHDVLKMGPELISSKPLLRKIVAARFPFIFVDESQDTIPEFVAALKKISHSVGDNVCLGYFGDPMQKIYLAGAGNIEPEDGWETIRKSENFRCPLAVLELINKIRAEEDHLVQTRGRTVDIEGELVPVRGTARVFVCPADSHRSERISQIRHQLSLENDDSRWEENTDAADVRVLVLVHRMAANRLGFPDLYSSLNDNGASSLKEGLIDGSAWVFRPFLQVLLPLVESAATNSEFRVISILKNHSPYFSKASFQVDNASNVLAQLKTTIDGLVKLLESGSKASVREVLSLALRGGIVEADERFVGTVKADDSSNEVPASQSHLEAAVVAFLDCPAVQLWEYKNYIDNQSPFSTHQGVKGAEFERVLVILDDEESAYKLFSYGKYLGTTTLSNTDKENIDEGKDSVVSRTRRLFYVCCSRAIQDLAVVWFVADVDAAKSVMVKRGFFPREDIHLID